MKGEMDINVNDMRSAEEIEAMLAAYRPAPGDRFYRKMETAPWKDPLPSARRLSVLRLAAALGVLLALNGWIFFTPQGRALAQHALRYFFKAGSDSLSAEQIETTPPVEPQRNQAIAEIEAQSGLPVYVPERLPEGMQFYGASYDESQEIVIQQYGFAPEDIRLSIKQQPFATRAACTLCGLVGASAPVTEVSIRDVDGEYVEGVWELTDAGPVWRNDPYLKTLRWQEGGTAFEMIFMGTEMERDDLIAVAAGLRPGAGPLITSAGRSSCRQRGERAGCLRAPPARFIPD